eukprot:scaffold48713_cov28-Tisochrysis_lutea.AAC.1
MELTASVGADSGNFGLRPAPTWLRLPNCWVSCCKRIDWSRDHRLRIAWSVRPGRRRAISNHLWPSSATPCTMMSSSALVHELRSLRKLLTFPAVAPPPPPPEPVGDLPPADASLVEDLAELDGPILPGRFVRGDSGPIKPAPPTASAPEANSERPTEPPGHPLSPLLPSRPPSSSDPAPSAEPPTVARLNTLSRPLLHLLRTASSERPGNCAAMTRQRHPNCSTPLRISSSSCGDHSFRGSAAACVCRFVAVSRAYDLIALPEAAALASTGERGVSRSGG